MRIKTVHYKLFNKVFQIQYFCQLNITLLRTIILSSYN
jgi:hypothetical protein